MSSPVAHSTVERQIRLRCLTGGLRFGLKPHPHAKRQGFRYESREEQVYVSKTQYFEPVTLELWEYQIGGYQVLAKWLKDRRDRRVTLEEIKTYCRVVTAIQRTITLQEEIDALYPEAEKQVVMKSFSPGT